MRTKFKAWAEPYILEHPEIRIFDEDISSLVDVTLEIGSGKGLFITEMAKKFPSTNFVGVERNVTCTGFMAKKIVEQEILNAKIIYGDASRLLVNLKDKVVNNIYLNFSDPWPKLRHEKRRLTSTTFLSTYTRILKDTGKIYFKTDNKELFLFSCDMFAENGFNIISRDENYDGKDEFDTQTEYEMKNRALNNPIYRIIMEKK